MKRMIAFILLITSAGLTAKEGGIHPTANTWNLTDYLKGTPTDIRHTLYSDIVRLNRAIRKANGEIDEAAVDATGDQASCMKRCRERPDYLALKSDRDAAEADLRSAREAHDGQATVDASSRFNRARIAMQKIETAALAEDGNLHTDNLRIAEWKGKLSDEQKSLARAIAWKDKLLAAAANTLRLEWPLDPGAKGFLGTIKVDEVLDNGIIANFTAFEQVSAKDAGEGLAVAQGIFHDVKVVIPIANPSVYRHGSRVLLDKTYVVAAVKDVGAEIVYFVREAPSDRDGLWKAITAPIQDGDLAPTTGPSR